LAYLRVAVIIDHVANPLWEPDGTQPPPPFQAWEDPVSGLVTGAAYKSDPFEVDVAEPVMPDMSEVRRAVDAVLSAEDEPSAPVVPRQRRRPLEPPKVTPGLVPPNPRAGWPRNPSARQLAGLRPRVPTVNRPATRIPRPPGQRRPQGSTAGWTGLIILIIVVIVIALTAISSLVDTITGLFD
jgi:hypothetical protein